MSACLLNVITLAAKLLVNQFEVCALFACYFNVKSFFLHVALLLRNHLFKETCLGNRD